LDAEEARRALAEWMAEKPDGFESALALAREGKVDEAVKALKDVDPNVSGVKPKSVKASEPITMGSSRELIVGKPVTLVREGAWDHPEYGQFAITADDIDRMVANFDANVTKQETPIDVDHDHSAGAVGWVQRVTKDVDDKGRAVLKAIVNWTDDQAGKVGNAFRHMSIHFDPEYMDAETGESYGPTLRSASVTNFPFVKDMEPIALSELTSYKEGKMSEEKKEEEGVKLTEAEAAEVKELTGLLPRLRSLFKGEEKKEEEKPDDVRLTELQTSNLKLREELEATAKQMAELQAARRRERFLSVIEQGRWVGDRERSLALMEVLADTKGEDSEEFKGYVAEQSAHAEQIWKSKLFEEAGTTGGQAPTAGESVQKELSEIREAMKLSNDPAGNSVALTEYYRRHPDEYTEAQRQVERRKREV